MFAKSETLPIFVLPRTGNYVSSNVHTLTAYKAGLLFENSTYVVFQFLAELGGSASLFIHIQQLFSNKMPRTEKVSIAANNSTRIAHTSHTFRVKIHSYYSFDDGHRDEYTLDTVVTATSRAEAIGKAIISASAIHPNYDIRPLLFGGYRICEQLD